MLSIKQNNTANFIIAIVVIAQFALIFSLQLFGDESFYWLESQYLDWSYTDLPGWTAWMIRFSTELLGHNYFAVRLPGFLAYISLLYCWSRYLAILETQSIWAHLLLVVTIPLMFILPTMALPDIWMLFCVSWMIYFTILAMKTEKNKYWAILGAFIAISLNVHIRLWLWLFIAGLIWLIIFHKDKKHVQNALLVSLPIGLLGFLPILFFNLNNDFPMLRFQLSERQPWSFQIQNFSFIFIQVLVISPLLFFLWLRSFNRLHNNPILKWIQLTALVHFCFYILVGLFADSIRTNAHWMLASYIPVLVTVNLFNKVTARAYWLAITLALLTTIITATYILKSNSYLKSKWVQNSTYWHELSDSVKNHLEQNNLDKVITDYFMTTSQLRFELPNTLEVLSMKHHLNSKHGRAQQLELMNLIAVPQDYSEKTLVVLEDSAIKLKNKDTYYQEICSNFQSLRKIDSLFDFAGKKTYHIFISNDSKQCELPAFVYIESKKTDGFTTISGWIMHSDPIIELSIVDEFKSKLTPTSHSFKDIDLSQSFPFLSKKLSHHQEFSVTTRIKNSQIQLVFKDSKDNNIFSKIYYIN